LDLERLGKIVRSWLEDSGKDVGLRSNNFQDVLYLGIKRWSWLWNVICPKKKGPFLDLNTLKILGPDLFETLVFLLNLTDPTRWNPYLPYIMKEELKNNLEKFIPYLEKQKDAVVETGYPDRIFHYSTWFFQYLTRTLVVKEPEGFQPIFLRPDDVPQYNCSDLFSLNVHSLVRKMDEDVTILDPLREYTNVSKDGYRLIFYCWGRTTYCDHTEDSEDYYTEESLVTYKDSNGFSFLTKEDVTFCNEIRESFFKLKMNILQKSVEVLSLRNSDNVWNSTVKLINEQLAKNQIDRLFAIEFIFVKNNKTWDFGGLYSLLMFAWLIQKEIDKGILNTIKQECHFVSGIPSNAAKRIIYLDDVLDKAVNLYVEEKESWNQFYMKLKALFSVEIPEVCQWKSVMDLQYAPAIADYLKKVEKLETKSEKIRCALKKDRTERDENNYFDSESRTIVWKCILYTLTPKQAKVVGILYDAHQNKRPDMPWEYILENTDIQSSRYTDIFKRLRGYKELIEPGERKGTIRLKA